MLQSVVEEIRARAEREAAKEASRLKRGPDVVAGQKRDLPQEQPTPRPHAERHEPIPRQMRHPAPAGPEDELQRLFREGLKRRRQMGAPARRPQPPKQPAYTERAQPRREERPTVLPRPEPRIERPYAVPEEQRPVFRMPEPPPFPAARRMEPLPELPKRRKTRETVEREVREKPPMPELLSLGRWDLNELRKNIIVAEILGPPKALRDIDSHVI